MDAGKRILTALGWTLAAWLVAGLVSGSLQAVIILRAFSSHGLVSPVFPLLHLIAICVMVWGVLRWLPSPVRYEAWLWWPMAWLVFLWVAIFYVEVFAYHTLCHDAWQRGAETWQRMMQIPDFVKSCVSKEYQVAAMQSASLKAMLAAFIACMAQLMVLAAWRAWPASRTWSRPGIFWVGASVMGGASLVLFDLKILGTVLWANTQDSSHVMNVWLRRGAEYSIPFFTAAVAMLMMLAMVAIFSRFYRYQSQAKDI